MAKSGSQQSRSPAELIDEFARCAIESPEELRELFVPRFFFGCEADDPQSTWAFDSRRNPLGAKLGAIFSSDIGHWDVPDMRGVLPEAFELCERGLVSEANLRAFLLDNPVRLWGETNPRYFDGTPVEAAAREILGERPPRAEIRR